MIERAIVAAAAAVVALGMTGPGVRAESGETLAIGYVELADDVRYAPIRGAEKMILATRGRPFPAAQVALDEAAPLEAVIHRRFALERLTLNTIAELAPAVSVAIAERDTRFFVLDLPGAGVAALVGALREHGDAAVLFNATAPDDSLRREVCAAQLVHTLPSLAMTSDALAQYLAFRKWRDVLLLQGPLADDQRLTDAFARSSAKFGLRIVERRPFRLGNDPRERDENNIALLSTTTRDYDSVFVADGDGEFARGLPYRTTRPRPVIGSAGLAAEAWHSTWDRYGAPQLLGRFQNRAGRHMTGADWSVWMATKMIVQAALRSGSGGFARLRTQLFADATYDGVKGLAVSVRPWDHQLRQAILLTTTDAVVASAPLPGFLHATNELDTLGDDQPETPCRLSGS
jgi:ABC transporter substrate binding protein (PQQ-dependent alcohol dehydrogenase system)